MYTETTGPPPSFEVEKVERMGDEYEVTTRITIEGLNATQVTEAIKEALRVSRLTTHTGE